MEKKTHSWNYHKECCQLIKCLKKMIEHFDVCRTHVGQKVWKNHVKKLDTTMSHPDKTRVICTDFGATLDLRAAETDNSSINF